MNSMTKQPTEMKRELTKEQRRRLRELSDVAYERDLSNELTKLELQFKQWRSGEIDAFALSDAIHRFHQGPSRELFSKYDPSNREFAVAHAIHRGLVSKEEAGEDMLQALARHLAFLAVD